MTDQKTNQCDPTQAYADYELWRLRGTVVDNIAEFGIDHDLTRRSKEYLLDEIYAARANVLAALKMVESNRRPPRPVLHNTAPSEDAAFDMVVFLDDDGNAWTETLDPDSDEWDQSSGVQNLQEAHHRLTETLIRLGIIPYRSDADLLAGRPRHERP